MAQGPSSKPLLSEHDVYLLAEGTYKRAYERLGAHLTEVDGVRGVRFAVWAPNAAQVSAAGSFNAWDPAAHPMLRHGATGIWECFVPRLGPGALYKYHIVSRLGEHAAFKADPYAFWAELPPGTASAVYDLSGYTWGDGAWIAGRAERQRHDRPLAIYEVHAGSWRRVPEEGNRPLTYRELAHQLAPYAKEMGYTHVELMPITEYPVDQSWGYQVTGYFAPTARYGTPHDFMYFVDYCHRHELGVLLDWVPAHFAKEEHGLGLFDGAHLYEHADLRLGEHPVWGTYIFNFGRAEVRNFLLSSALFWLDQYHVDGFRVDAVASMVWLDHARPESHWGTNKYGGRENLDAVDFLQRFNALVHEEHPGVITTAEEATTYTWVTGRLPSPPGPLSHQGRGGAPTAGGRGGIGTDGAPPSFPSPLVGEGLGVRGNEGGRETSGGGTQYRGGGAPQAPIENAEDVRPHTLGFDYKWNMGWMHDTLDYFEADPVLRSELHQHLTFPIWYAFNERYVLPLSHDEVVHLKKALLTKMPGDDWQRFANLRALFAYMTAHPGKKLLFMGGEFGQWAEWSESRSLDWHLLGTATRSIQPIAGSAIGPNGGGEAGTPCRTGGDAQTDEPYALAPLHRGLQRCVGDLNRLYAETPALHELDSRPRGFDWIDYGNAKESVISFLRRGHAPGQVVVVVCNFTPVVRHAYPVGVPIPGEWREVLNTDAPEYGGSGVVNGTVYAEPGTGMLGHGTVRCGQSVRLTLPPLGVVFLRPCR
ncbi:MAG: 1,4-alpha-glucan branching enzyme [Chloroflexi bacterium]|nr:1,4-alpha-glucan branching enzyme [Chloroflexota bacterium]